MSLLGLMIPRDELLDKIPMMGADVANADYEQWDIEFFPNRPDLFSVEGVARAFRNFLCDDDDIKEFGYDVEDSGIVCNVDPNIKEIRPFIGCAKVTGVHFTDELITSLMNLQEKLHLTLGRKRVKVAIGVYDISPIVPPIHYKATDPKDVVFVPLEETEAMNLAQILRRHKKGQEYGFVMEAFDKYPILMDDNGTVLSFPPIINSEVTRVKENSTDLFVDVTGTSEDAVRAVLNIMCTALADRHAKVHSVTVKYPDRTVVTPDLSFTPMELDLLEANAWLGIDLSPDECSLALRHMGYKVDDTLSEGKLQVYIPPYRADILHPVDLFEDIGIGYGYERIPSILPKSLTFGKLRKEQGFVDKLRKVFMGLGFYEVNTLTLSCEEHQYTHMGRPVPEEMEYVKITNPISKDHTILRMFLMPSLFNTLKANKHRELPQQIFEVGIVVDQDAKNRFRASALMIDSRANFTNIKSLAEALVRELYVSYEILAKDMPPYIPGRCAAIVVEGEEVGDFGEVTPATISAFELGNPVIGLNLDVEKIITVMGSGEETANEEEG